MMNDDPSTDAPSVTTGKVIVCSDSSLPLVHVSTAAIPGACLDPPGKEGLTRLVSRLMRRTAGGRKARQLDEHLDQLGSSLGADVNCTSAGFSGSVLSRSLEPFMDVLKGALETPSLDAAEFERLRRESLAEVIEMRDDDRSVARSWFRRTVFSGHPYGRSSLGTTASLKRLTLDDAHERYATLSRKEGLIFAFAGDISDQAANAHATRITHELRGSSAGFEPGQPEPVKGRRLLLVDKPDRTQTQILIGGLGTHPSDPDHTALYVANTVFGGTFTSRLTQEVRAERGWSYGAYSSLPYDRQRQAFSMWTFPAATDAADCIALELQLLTAWVEHGITEQELETAKQYLVRSNVFNSDTAAKRMSLQLDEMLYRLPKGYYDDYAERVAAVTLEEANAAIQRRISTENLQIVVVGTVDAIRESVEAAIPGLADARVVPFDAEED